LSSPYEKVLTSSELDILWKLAILWRRSILVHLLVLAWRRSIPPSTNRVRRRVTSLMRRLTTLPLCQTVSNWACSIVLYWRAMRVCVCLAAESGHRAQLRRRRRVTLTWLTSWSVVSLTVSVRQWRRRVVRRAGRDDGQRRQLTARPRPLITMATSTAAAAAAAARCIVHATWRRNDAHVYSIHVHCTL